MELMSLAQINKYMAKVPNWSLEDSGKSIICVFEFAGFREAIDFINKIAEIAEQEAHHPSMKIYNNKVEILLTTHSLGGLTEKDFNLAEKIDKINF